jgi:decaprenylphospho-beta-D-erythro-pentofuranosid-2-ulose 2-reductase
MKPSILILGAGSAVAEAAAEQFAEKGHPLFLAGRHQEDLRRIARNLTVRYQVTVKWGFFDADQREKHPLVVQNAVREMNGLGGALLAFGARGNHQKALKDPLELEAIVSCNFLGACTVLHDLASYFENKEAGFLAVISSALSDRAAKDDYIYTSAKGGLTLFLQGLRHRLHAKGVRVITVKLGNVDTPMTFGKQGLFYPVSPEYAGKKIAEAVHSTKEVVYVPGFWRYAMWAVKAVPEKFFKRLSV